MKNRTNRSSSRLAARVLGSGLLTLVALSGCTGNGRYTTEHKNAAKLRMEQLKSATEWQMGHQAFLAGDLPKALKHVTYSIELNEEVAKSHVLKGRILMEMGQLEMATTALQQAETVDPKNAEAWYYQGILAERIDRKEEALRRYQGALDLDATNPQYAIAAAEMMISLDHLDQAETFLIERAGTFDHSAGIKQTLGHIAMLREQPEKAVPLFREARLLAPDDATVTVDLVRAQIATGNIVDAEALLARVLASPDTASRRDLIHLRAKCLLQLDRPVEARDLLVRLTTDSGGASDIDAWIELGQVAYVLEDYNRVRSAAARVIAAAPARPEGYVLRALVLRQSKDLSGAEQSFRRALAIRKDAETLILLGMTYRQMNRQADANACFKEALRLNPGDETASRLLASR